LPSRGRVGTCPPSGSDLTTCRPERGAVRPQSDPLRRIWRDRIGRDELVVEMDQALRLPGQTNAWTMPIKARIDMLTTGVRTPVGIKIYGADLAEIERVGMEVEAALRDVPGTRSAFAERAAGGYFVDLDLRRDEIARYGLSVAAVQDVVLSVRDRRR
jgi:Cu(I)/Ag(I) efflux system membrane protein CusA/SilA